MSGAIDPEFEEFMRSAGEILISAVMSAGVDKETAQNATRSRFLEIFGNAKESGEDIGTLWATGRKPKSKEGKEAVRLINKDLQDKYRDGVRDEDIVDWWNCTQVAREILFEQFNMMRLGIMIHVANTYGDQFDSMDEIGEYVGGRARCVTPFFTISPNPGNANNEARGLPMELIPRVIEWLETFEVPGYDVPNSELPNMNALIREEIAAGNI